MSGSMELAAARSLRRVDAAIEAIAAAGAGAWSGTAASAYEVRRSELAVAAARLRRSMAAIVPVARSADAEAAVWLAVRGVVA